MGRCRTSVSGNAAQSQPNLTESNLDTADIAMGHLWVETGK